MRDFGSTRTHASNGQELSQFFIADDGMLTIYIQESETEIQGFHQSCFGGGWITQEK